MFEDDMEVPDFLKHANRPPPKRTRRILRPRYHKPKRSERAIKRERNEAAEAFVRTHVKAGADTFQKLRKAITWEADKRTILDLKSALRRMVKQRQIQKTGNRYSVPS